MAIGKQVAGALRVLRGRAEAIDPRKYGRRESELLRAVQNNTNAKDQVFHNLLNCFRVLNWLARSNGQSIQGKDLLEIGTSQLPGLPLILLAAGCRSVAGNNVFRLDDHLAEDYVRVIKLLLCGLLPIDPAAVEALVRWDERDGHPVALLDPDRFANRSPTPAEQIQDAPASFDVIFSFSVLEHVEQPRAVLEKSFELLRPGGWCFHTIDLRDHSDFTRPIDFLRSSESEYRDRTGAPENRLRASDFLELFEAVGFVRGSLRLLDEIPELAAPGKTDVARLLEAPLEQTWSKTDLAAVDTWVDDAFRDTLDARFQKKSLEDLSVLGMAVGYRKPD